MNRLDQKEFFDAWIKPRLESYEEPSRIGVSRGDKIGYSKVKYYAAHAQVLHTKALYNLREIAGIVGVSFGQLRLWRTEKDFLEAAAKAKWEFGHHLLQKFNEELWAWRKFRWEVQDLASQHDIDSFEGIEVLKNHELIKARKYIFAFFCFDLWLIVNKFWQDRLSRLIKQIQTKENNREYFYKLDTELVNLSLFYSLVLADSKQVAYGKEYCQFLCNYWVPFLNKLILEITKFEAFSPEIERKIFKIINQIAKFTISLYSVTLGE